MRLYKTPNLQSLPPLELQPRLLDGHFFGDVRDQVGHQEAQAQHYVL